MNKGSSLVLKEISSGLLRRGSKEFVASAQRRNSICGPCIGLKSPSKLVSDEPISSFFENSTTNLQDFQSQQESYQHTKSQSYSTTNYLSSTGNSNRGNNGRKASITSIINSIKNEKIKNQKSLNNQMEIQFPRRFSIDPLSMSTIKETNKNNNSFPSFEPSEKFKSINLDEKLLELEAESTFSSVWNELVHKYGLENLEFPKEITFLAGSPGSGKGTNTECLKQVLGVKEEPIVMSSLLSSPECVAIKKAGGLVNDKVVLELLLNKLAKPDFLCENQGLKQGVIIDGFPRSAKQVKFVELLYDKLCQIRTSINPNATLPRFRICVLHVSEEESIKRQLARGDYANKENILRKEKNLPLLEIRDTDVDPIASKKRYSLYQEQFNHLKSLENKFDFDMIDANGSKQQVKNIIQSIYQ